MPWLIRGSYFEACNCDPICPCRRIDGVMGGRSTHGVCMGVLSWVIEDGVVDGVDVAGFPVALALHYSDDEAGSPWTWVLYLDARASDEQRAALEGVFTGRLGGDAESALPLGVEGEQPRGGSAGRHRRRPHPQAPAPAHPRPRRRPDRDRYQGEETVTCVIPGHDRSGEELATDRIAVEDEELSFRFDDVCGYASTFEYAG